jgi:hypothetical protein
VQTHNATFASLFATLSNGFMKCLSNALLLLLAFSSCNIINPDEPEPAYVNIDTYSFHAVAGQGTSDQKITDMWVYANDDIQGVFDVPSSIPVLRTGTTDIKVFAGIKQNGISSTRIRYPFFTVFDTTLNLSSLGAHTITPHFTYTSGVSVDDSRDFESGVYFQEATQSNEGTFQVINDPAVAFEGNKCGKASLSGGLDFMQFMDNTELTLESGNAIFLEMNYSCNNTFAIGVFTTTSGSVAKNPVLYITPTTGNSGDVPEWNKIYVDLGAVALDNPSADFHQLYFESMLSESSTPTIFLDNLKIVKWIQ